MPEELKELIAKIQQEGVIAGEEKAASIEAAARRRGAEIVKDAQQEASGILAEAKAEIARMDTGLKGSLKQAARDTLLTLKKEMASLLDKIIAVHVHKALATDEMAKMIASLIKGFGGEHKDKIVISIRKDELEKIEKELLAELGSELKKGFTLKPSGDIRGGFLISFDENKSCYDFSDKALAEYIASYLKPQLGEILKEAGATGK